MDHKSQFSVLILFGIIVIAFLLLLSRGDVSKDGLIGRLQEQIKKLAGRGGKSEKPVHPNGRWEPTTTIIFDDTPRLVVEQLDRRTGEVVHRYPIETFRVKNKYGKFSEVPDEREMRGYYISRPNAEEGDILLDGRCKEAYSVSKNHLFIGETPDGILYVVDPESKFGTFDNKTKKRIEGADIYDGMILILGKGQPIRFVIPEAPELMWFDEALLTNVEQEPSYQKKEVPNILRRIVK